MLKCCAQEILYKLVMVNTSFLELKLAKKINTSNAKLKAMTTWAQKYKLVNFYYYIIVIFNPLLVPLLLLPLPLPILLPLPSLALISPSYITDIIFVI
jgi:hypothetical protein